MGDGALFQRLALGSRVFALTLIASGLTACGGKPAPYAPLPQDPPTATPSPETPTPGEGGDLSGEPRPVDPGAGQQQDPIDELGPCSQNEGKLAATWTVQEIQQFEVLNRIKGDGRAADPDPKDFSRYANRPLCKTGSTMSQCLEGGPVADLIVSGTFSSGGTQVMGATVRRGSGDQLIKPDSKVYGRGGVAQLDDGSIVVCRPGENGQPQSLTSLNHVCGKNGAQVFDFMGGGALIVHKGWKVCSNGVGAAQSPDQVADCDQGSDLYRVQRFDQLGAGIDSDQMHQAQHTIVAIKKGRAYLAWPEKPGKTGRQIQSEFCAAGYDEVLKFDGGNGFYVRGRGGLSVGAGTNPSALLVKLKAK